MSKTKARILETARRLFNEQGYGNVTIRMIALELGISPGNLNYHFKTREDILDALYFEMVEAFDSRVDRLGEEEITLQTIKRDIHRSMARMIGYRFFWTDLYNLLRLSDAISAHFDGAYHRRYAGYEQLLGFLSGKGLLAGFEFAAERQLLIERMIGFGNTWLYHSCVYGKAIDAAYIDHQALSLMAMMYPYLTEKGKADFRAVGFEGVGVSAGKGAGPCTGFSSK